MEDNITQKIRKEIADILAEIKAGDVMALISAFSAVLVIGAIVYFISQGEYLFAVILAILSPASILILTITTRMVINRLSRVLSASNKKKEGLPNGSPEMPKTKDLVDKIKSDIIQFRETLKPIKNLNSDEQQIRLALARNILNELLNDKLPQAEKIFPRYKQIRGKLNDLDVKYQDYCSYLKTMGLGIYIDWETKRKLWGTLGDDNSLESVMFVLVDDLIDLLNKEHGNSNALRQVETLPPIVAEFSNHLEDIKKERIGKDWKLTGLSLRFLDEIKSTPPFLGLRYERQIISDSDEQTLTEFFIASIYMEEHRDSIRGGNYTIRHGDDNKIIAKKVYGHERYEFYVNRTTFPQGTPIELPYFNLNRPDHPDDVKRKRSVSRDLEKIISLLESYNLTRDEAIPVLRMVYDAAHMTLNMRQK